MPLAGLLRSRHRSHLACPLASLQGDLLESPRGSQQHNPHGSPRDSPHHSPPGSLLGARQDSRRVNLRSGHQASRQLFQQPSPRNHPLLLIKGYRITSIPAFIAFQLIKTPVHTATW